MRRFLLFATIALLICATGCVPSLYPLYTDSDLIQNPQLEGRWVNNDRTETWEFSLAEDSISYDLTYTENERDDTKHFKAHLLMLDSLIYLDTYPVEEIKNDFYRLHLIPAHVFGRVEMEGDTLGLALFNTDWLRDMIKKGTVEIAHENVEEGLVLTAPTGKLQQLIIKHAKEPRAFSDLSVLHRE
jgi:hypothetical protein